MQVRAATVCPFCGCQCGMYLVGEDRLTAAAVPAQRAGGAGRLCLRGWQAGALLHSSRLLDCPLIRSDGAVSPTEWDEALTALAESLAQMSEPGALGVLLAGSLTDEEAFALKQLTEQALANAHVDGLFSLHEGAALLGLRDALGEVPQGERLSQIPDCDLLISFTGDLPDLYPQAAAYVLEAVDQGVPLIVLDNIPGTLGELAEEVVMIEPGDLATASRALAGESREGAPEALAAVREKLQASECPGLLIPLAQICSPQAAVAIGHLVASLRSAAGKAHMFLLQGEPNITGVSDVALRPAGAGEVQPVSAAEMLVPGKLRGLVVVGADLGTVMPQGLLEELAGSLDLLAVIDSYRTATTDLADVVLPMAGFGERAGTVTGCDGLLRWTEQAFEPGGQRRPLIDIIMELGRRFDVSPKWQDLQELQGELSREIPAYGQIDWDSLQREDIWPRGTYPVSDVPRSLSTETAPATSPPQEGQFVLLVRPDGQGWALDARTQGRGILAREYRQSREPYVWISAEDLQENEWRAGTSLWVTTEHGTQNLRTRSREGLRPGWVILPRQFAEQVRNLAGPPHVHEPVGGWEWPPTVATISSTPREAKADE